MQKQMTLSYMPHDLPKLLKFQLITNKNNNFISICFSLIFISKKAESVYEIFIRNICSFHIQPNDYII